MEVMALESPQRSLKTWIGQDWDYINPKDKDKPKSKRGRYLPKDVRESLTPYQKAQENKKKRQATRKGEQRASYSKDVARKVRNAT
jgi:hypothetical protein